MEQQIKEYGSLMELLDDLDREGITGFRRQELYKTFLGFRARMLGIPYGGSFELTPLCNFDCRMCYVHLSNQQLAGSEGLLSTQQWLDIMKQAVDAGMMHADLTGGECLTYPGFKELYLYLVSNGVEVSVLTNGQLIDEEMADFFAKYPPSLIQITVYGSDEDAYERVTGRRAFRQVMDAVERLKARNIRMLLTTTPSRFMQEDTHALLECLRSLHVRYVIGTGSLPARPDTGRELETYAPEAELYAKLHLDERAYVSANYQAIPAPEKNIFPVPKGFRADGKVGCSSGQSSFHINWKGEMTPCIPFYTVARSVIEEGFDAAWNWIRHQMKAFELPEECGSCPHKEVCTACPAEKSMGRIKGKLNREVCRRTEAYLRCGIVNMPDSADCTGA